MAVISGKIHLYPGKNTKNLHQKRVIGIFILVFIQFFDVYKPIDSCTDDRLMTETTQPKRGQGFLPKLRAGRHLTCGRAARCWRRFYASNGLRCRKKKSVKRIRHLTKIQISAVQPAASFYKIQLIQAMQTTTALGGRRTRLALFPPYGPASIALSAPSANADARSCYTRFLITFYSDFSNQ